MAPLAADRKYKNRWTGRTLSLPVAASAIPYQGGLVAESATGYAAAAGTTAGTRVMGWSLAKQDNTGGADGAIRVLVQTGVILLDNDATNPVGQSDIGRQCFVKDDHTVQTAAGGSVVIAGRVEDIDPSGGIWVYVAPEVGAITGSDIPPIVDNQSVASPMVVENFAIPDAAGDVDYDIVLKRKMQVIDIVVGKSVAGAGNTVTVKKGATAISNAIAADTDKAITRAGTIDPAQSTLNVGDTLRVSAHRAAGSMLATVTVIGLPR